MPAQFDLFCAPGDPLIPGLLLIPEAISTAEEAEYAALIDAAPLTPFAFGSWTGRRLTCSFGSGYDYPRAALTEAPALPTWLVGLRDRLAPRVGLDCADLVQALLTRYDPGAGIGWHRDRPQYGQVLGLSLSYPAALRLRRRAADGRFERRALPLPPRSLYLLAGEARQVWQHSIAAGIATRRSITLRSLV